MTQKQCDLCDEFVAKLVVYNDVKMCVSCADDARLEAEINREEKYESQK